MKSFKTKLKEFLEDSCCSFEINLLSWELRWDIGKDNENDCTQIWWCFISCGPIKLKIAQAHWDQW